MTDTVQCSRRGRDSAADTALYAGERGNYAADTAQCPVIGGDRMDDNPGIPKLEGRVRLTLVFWERRGQH